MPSNVVNNTESVNSVDYICISYDKMSFDKNCLFCETNENFNESVNENLSVIESLSETLKKYEYN